MADDPSTAGISYAIVNPPPPPELEQGGAVSAAVAQATPDTTLSQGPSAQDAVTKARMEGYSWPEIDNHVSVMRGQSATFGYSDQEVDQHLGYADPKPIQNALQIGSEMNLAAAPPDSEDHPLTSATEGLIDPAQDNGLAKGGALSPALRSDYATALLNGQVKGPNDFAAQYTDAAAQATGNNDPILEKASQGIAAQLPSNEDLTDYSIAIARDMGYGQLPNGKIITAQVAQTVRKNLIAAWAQSNMAPQASYQRANTDPAFAQALANAPEDEDRKMPGPGYIPGELHTNDAIAPVVPFGAPRPFAPGEYNRNPDGSWSSEESMTVAGDKSFNGGKATNIPSLWLRNGKPYVVHDEDEATQFAKASGLKWPSYNSIKEADAAAAQREIDWQGMEPEDARKVDPLWTKQEPYSPSEEELGQGGAGERGLPQDEGTGIEIATRALKAFAAGWADAHGVPEDHAQHYMITNAISAVMDTLSQTGGGVVLGTTRAAAATLAGLIGLPADSSTEDQMVRELMAGMTALTLHGAHPVFEPAAGVKIPMVYEGTGGLARAEGGSTGLPGFTIAPQVEQMLGDQLTRLNALPANERPDPALSVGQIMGKAVGDFFSDERGTVNISPEAQTSIDLFKKYLGAQRTFGDLVAGRDQASIAENLADRASKEFFKNANRFLNGNMRLRNEIGKVQLEHTWKDLSTLLPEYEDWMKEDLPTKQRSIDNFRAMTEGRSAFEEQLMGKLEPDAGALPLPKLLQINHYMEGRSMGATLDPALGMFRSIADTLRSHYVGMRDEIESRASIDSMYEDYIRHSYKDIPANVDKAYGIGFGKQGTGAHLQLRTIPTQLDAIYRGLTPKFAHPTENYLHYAAGMRSHLNTLDQVVAATESGNAVWSATKPRGDFAHWLALKGKATTKSFVDQDGKPRTLQVYARPGYATSYNRSIGRGFYDWDERGISGSVYNALQKYANANIASKLLLPFFHLGNIIDETWTSGMARAQGMLQRGEVVRAAAEYGLSLPILPKLALNYYKSFSMKRVLLGLEQGTPLEQEIAGLMRDTNFLPFDRGVNYMIGSGGNLIRSLNRGTLGYEARQGLAHVTEDFDKVLPALQTAKVTARTFARGAAALLHIAGRTLDTTMWPLFDDIIPRLKMMAFADEMGDAIRTSPGMSREALLGTARRLGDSMEDRFGEMNLDNLFWHKTAIQVFNLLAVSVGWELGSMRSIFGGAKDIAQLKLGSTRARWLPSLLVTQFLQSAMYQYIKTGTTPWSTGLVGNTMNPRTGGTAYGQPELANMWGYGKDLLQLYKNFVNLSHSPVESLLNMEKYAAQHLGPLGQTVQALATQTVWPGRAAAPHRLPGGGGEWMLNGAKDLLTYAKIAAGEWKPIVVENLTGKKPGSNISTAETIAGLRAAGRWREDPAGTRAFQDKADIRALRAQEKADDDVPDTSGPSVPRSNSYGPSRIRSGNFGPSVIRHRR